MPITPIQRGCCCQGKDELSRRCRRRECACYLRAISEVRASWPYEGTGFGNLYGEPTHAQFLRQVRRNSLRRTT